MWKTGNKSQPLSTIISETSLSWLRNYWDTTWFNRRFHVRQNRTENETQKRLDSKLYQGKTLLDVLNRSQAVKQLSKNEFNAFKLGLKRFDVLSFMPGFGKQTNMGKTFSEINGKAQRRECSSKNIDFFVRARIVSNYTTSIQLLFDRNSLKTVSVNCRKVKKTLSLKTFSWPTQYTMIKRPVMEMYPVQLLVRMSGSTHM